MVLKVSWGHQATLGYSGLLWATLSYSGLLPGYSGLLWATLGYSGLLWGLLKAEALWRFPASICWFLVPQPFRVLPHVALSLQGLQTPLGTFINLQAPSGTLRNLRKLRNLQDPSGALRNLQWLIIDPKEPSESLRYLQGPSGSFRNLQEPSET